MVDNQTRTATIDLSVKNKVKATSSFSSKRNSASKIGKTSSRTSPVKNQANNLNQIHRKDTYNDGLKGFVDENIEELAKLIALKKKIESDILD